MDTIIIRDIRKSEKESEEILKNAETEKGKILQKASSDAATKRDAAEASWEEKKQTALENAKKDADIEAAAITADAQKKAAQLRSTVSENVGTAVSYVEKEFMKAIK